MQTSTWSPSRSRELLKCTLVKQVAGVDGARLGWLPALRSHGARREHTRIGVREQDLAIALYTFAQVPVNVF